MRFIFPVTQEAISARRCDWLCALTMLFMVAMPTLIVTGETVGNLTCFFQIYIFVPTGGRKTSLKELLLNYAEAGLIVGFGGRGTLRSA